MTELQIIGGERSNYVWCTRIACTEKGVPYKVLSVAPHTPEVDAIHPLGRIPVLRHGDVTLFESRAICAYIDRAFPGPPLIPVDPVGAALAEQWLSLVNTAIDPVMMRQYLMAYVYPGTPDNSPNRAAIDAAFPKMSPLFALLDRAVAKTGHLVGNGFTLADMNLIPILFYMSKRAESGAMMAKQPHLMAYFERHMARPSVRDTTPPPSLR